MEDKRVFLVGCILQGMAQRGNIYFGMAEDALAIADATIEQMRQVEPNLVSSPHQTVQEDRSQYG